MGKIFELTKEEYDKMVADNASLRRSCKKLKEEIAALKEENQKLLAEVIGMKFRLESSEGMCNAAEKCINEIREVVYAKIVKVRISFKGKKPVVVVFWDDGTSEYVRCNPADTFSVETGVALCVCKRFLIPEFYRKYIVNGDYTIENDQTPRKKEKKAVKKAAEKAAVKKSDDKKTSKKKEKK